ncbi:hypothetical protein L486_02087 [Kwoniella mangroviensis CBS 10435]|uniref:Uncharacterized protein n=1 Tax=Kwoniella mangroviensis CBS 10435 TaxID=1331196 RepID=A0A1B9IV55_9TREE|nr:hypothetical protein L486_02087 [Kwoniella mangroviensis CBS 10435]
MLSTQSSTVLGMLTISSLAVSAMKVQQLSDTKITFSDGTGRTLSSGDTIKAPTSTSNSCTKEGIDYQDPAKFDYVIFGDDGDSISLKLSCQAKCKALSDDQAEYTFIKDQPFLRGTHPEIGRVWCDKVLERDESIWKKVEDVPLPDSVSVSALK